MLHPQAQSEPDPAGSLVSGHPCPPAHPSWVLDLTKRPTPEHGAGWQHQPHAASFRLLHSSQASGKDEPDFQKGPALFVTRTAATPIRYKVHGRKSAHSAPIVWEWPSKSFLNIGVRCIPEAIFCTLNWELNLYPPPSCLRSSKSSGPAVFVFWPIYFSLWFSLMNSK